jgi:hypothetical protein
MRAQHIPAEEQMPMPRNKPALISNALFSSAGSMLECALRNNENE